MEKPRLWKVQPVAKRHGIHNKTLLLFVFEQTSPVHVAQGVRHTAEKRQREMPSSRSRETRKARTHRYHLFTDAAASGTSTQTARNSKGATFLLLECVVSLHSELSHEHQAKFHLHQPVQTRHIIRGLLHYSNNVPRVDRVTY